MSTARTAAKPAESSTREVRRLASLLDTSQALTGTIDLKAGLHRVLEILGRHHGAVRSTVVMLDEDTGQLQVEASDGLDRPGYRISYQLGEGITGRVVESGKSIVVPQISREPMFLNRASKRSELPQQELSFICVPIMLSRKAVGALGVDLKFKPDRDYDRTQKFLGVVASMISQAVKVQRLIDNERKKLLDENTHLRQELRERYDFSNLLGTSGPMRQICEQVAQVARTMTTALIRGESGTGKELIAHAIHYNSLRANKPFVKVSCAALPESLIESELFGYEKGAFTGAQQRKKGRFELAEGGTLFLDEIGDINLATQVKLLRVLQEREYERLGGTETLKSNVRLIAATNKDLEKAITDGHIPGGSLLPAERVHDLRAAAPGTEDRPPAAGRSLSRNVLADAQQEHQAHLDAGDRHADELSLAGERPGAGEHARAGHSGLRRPRDSRPSSPAHTADRRSVGHGHARLAARCGRRLRERSDFGRAENHARQPRQGRAPAEHDRTHHQLSGEEVFDRLQAV